MSQQPKQGLTPVETSGIQEPIIQEIPSENVSPSPTPSPTPTPAPDEPQYNKYTVSLDVDPAKRIINGVEKVSFKNKSKYSMDSVYFNVYTNAFRKNAAYKPYFNNFEDKIFARGKDYASIEIISVTVQNSDAEFKLEDTALEVLLAQSLQPQESIEITIQFEAYVPKISHRTGANDKAMWCGNFLPTLAVYENGKWQTNRYYKAGDPFYSEVANYVVEITTPMEYIVAGTGAFAVKDLGEKKVTTYTTKLVRDFAFAISKYFKIISDTNENGIVVNMYYYSDIPKQRLDELIKCAGESLVYFSREVGTYPYRQINIVECDLFYSGGMEYPAVIFMDSDYLRTEPSIRSLAHEVGHQWFYNLIGNNQITESWLDEGLTMLIQEGIFYDGEGLKEKMLNDYKALNAKLGLKKDTNLSQALGDFSSWADYYDIEYTKAKLMFYSLKLKMGDEKFSNFIKECCARYSFKIITRADFIALAEEIYEDSLQSFFTSWFYEKELPPLQ